MTPPKTTKRILVTGATGKVGRHFLARVLASDSMGEFSLRALCHNRSVEPHERLEVLSGSISERNVVHRALQDITHVLHFATCKETPNDVMDVAIKGLFWVLEECRVSPSFQRIILIGGDAALGHFFYPHPLPVTEQQNHSAYPGCYALSKVLEEVMLEQYFIQYGLSGCCLRAPWIMEKDDFKYSLSFGENVFGGPRWRDLVGPQLADEYVRTGAVPVMLDPNGEPVRRNFVHVSDLVDAILLALDHPKAGKQIFNICMDEPVDYRNVGNYLAGKYNLPTVDISTLYWSTWLDNTKARFLLGWRPRYDWQRLLVEAWSYERNAGDPRTVWYPG